MDEKEKRIEVLVPMVLAEMRRIGASERNIWTHQQRSFTPIKTFFKKHRVANYDDSILDDYVRECLRLENEGVICKARLRVKLKGVDRLREFYATGKLVWAFRSHGSRFMVSGHFEETIADFVATTEYTDNTKGDVIWALRKYLAFLKDRGANNFSDITIDLVKSFLLFASNHLKASSLNSVKKYMSVFHDYLKEHELCALDCSYLLSIRSPRERKVASFITVEEVAAVLTQIDTGTMKGKRDYAIIMLALTTGMRGSDIVSLRLSDINWTLGTISVVQSKTAEPLVLPLVRIAGEAIEDYILNARPSVATDHVFIRVLQPFMQLNNAMALDYMLKTYQEQAGIERTPFDGKGFHSIRRAMGRNLVVSGVPVATVAQVLGHKSPDSLRPYIALDTEHLMQCAVGFFGIEPRGRYA